MKKTIAWIAALALLAAAPALAGGLGLALPGDDAFAARCARGAATEAAALGFEMTAETWRDDPADAVARLAGQGAEGVAVYAGDPAAALPAIDAAAAAGLPVVLFDAIEEPEGADVCACVGSDLRACGAQLADWVGGQTDGEAVVAVVEGGDSDGSVLRMRGFVEQCAGDHPSIAIVAAQSGGLTREGGAAAARAMLESQPEISVVYAVSDDMALGAADACRALGRTDVLLVGMDGLPEAFEAVLDGALSATLDRRPEAIGAGAIRALADAVAGKAREEKAVVIEAAVVDAALAGERMN